MKVVSTKSKEVLLEKVRLTPRPQPRIVLKTARRTQQDEELAPRVQEHQAAGGITTGQQEIETPVEKEEFARKKGDREDTRSGEEHRETCGAHQDREATVSPGEEHRETCGANQDREATVSPGEEHRETCGEKEAELEPQMDYRIQVFPTKPGNGKKKKIAEKLIRHLVNVVGKPSSQECLGSGLATTDFLRPIQ